MDRAEAADRLLKVFKLERERGCRDDAVRSVGGLRDLVSRWSALLPALEPLFLDYRELDPAGRCQRLEQAELLLAGELPSAPAPSSLSSELSAELFSTGRTALRKLRELGLRSCHQLLYLEPRRYEDRRPTPNLADLPDGSRATVAGVVRSALRRRSQTGKTLFLANLALDSGRALPLVWFQQSWPVRQVLPGRRLLATGRLQRRGRQLQLFPDYFEIEEGASASQNFGRIVPVYSLPEGVSQVFIRRCIQEVLRRPLADPLPQATALGLPALHAALSEVHLPSDQAVLEKAQRRLRFDDYLYLELRSLLAAGGHDPPGTPFQITPEECALVTAALPFQLTGAQRRALGEIVRDMRRPVQMARLLQGDVGSGKTAVAASAAALAARQGYQAALMVPTEVLARQHLSTLQALLAELGIRTGLLMGATGPRERQALLAELAAGRIDLLVGTHALLEPDVQFARLGLVIIEEEHRFGVRQRRQLIRGRPDVLVMTATPIPRSLALTVYGDLDLSVIDELPPGRTPVRTRVIRPEHRAQADAFLVRQLQAGHQAYVVAPLVEESEHDLMADLQAVTSLTQELGRRLPGIRILPLHGKMSSAEKAEAIWNFAQRGADVLVSTTVIEVGIDVPNATVMVVEDAQRFGLAQLHQLRGRVGRGAAASYCVLVDSEGSRRSRERLGVLERYQDGFKIAEEDLRLRGPGELKGLRQSGLAELTLEQLAGDEDLIAAAKGLAEQLLRASPDLSAFPELQGELRRRVEESGLRDLI